MTRWLANPIWRLELRRIRRLRWWPGRRFFLFYLALLGAALIYGVMLLINGSLGVQLLILAGGAPLFCLVDTTASLLAFILPWAAPVLTGAAIARERELGTLNLLRTTLLTGRSIVLGKLAGSLTRLWPAILLLLLLSPLRIVMTMASHAPEQFLLLAGGFGLEMNLDWAWLALVSAVGWLKPWGALAFNAALGMSASVLSRTSGAAIAVALPPSS